MKPCLAQLKTGGKSSRNDVCGVEHRPSADRKEKMLTQHCKPFKRLRNEKILKVIVKPSLCLQRKDWIS